MLKGFCSFILAADAFALAFSVNPHVELAALGP
jgi:hypothetical protein